MTYLTTYLRETWQLMLDASPWLLLGLAAAGLIKAWVPASVMARWLGGRGLGAIVRGSLVGAPLPLCSCGVIPAAVGLRRQGASRGATVAFLVATPETGVDSIVLSWAMLGPLLTIARPIAAIISAIAAGVICQFLPEESGVSAPAKACGDGCGCHGDESSRVSLPVVTPRRPRWIEGLQYAASELFDDLAGWLLVGVLLAGLVATVAPAGAWSSWAHGPWAMLAAVGIGVPMYICATASTPLTAAMLGSGVSPGVVLAFLLAGPATNLATIVLVRQEMGWRVAAGYVGAIAGSAVLLGLATDLLVGRLGLDVAGQVGEWRDIAPAWLAYGCATVWLVLTARWAWRRGRKWLRG